MNNPAKASLREQQQPLIRKLADCIEDIWQRHLDLSPYVVPEGLGYVEGNLEGDRLVIENHCYQTPQFRKLHLELAQVGNSLDILHCVMFPNPAYALPIFGADLVGARGAISAAIADLSPINSDRSLPEKYHTALAALPPVQFSQPRELPQWGDIFSEFCLFVRPSGSQEEQAFLQRVQEFLTLHCQIARTEAPLNSQPAIEDVLAGQKYYCLKQQQNDKTRRVLEKSFGSEWTEQYMTTMLFDYSSSHQS
ncbi:phycocyanobilin:ferredoxin oxidoreductase [Leptothermofonsia sichuanensis E412]|uniref:phycocyanobilin:ferredoxin oxidoreductase n=1 Tax=Leptothermofonsia sichuanensis TaxID=2917832 RepID=UPI001CA61B3C|nr:phycocyanobilin:ferredoxin oxidoreductase [Leptothermofonsia sichuanensis]QZZ22309.1 phycocyanobilin:ferredoxin oxidoreductase [Leptothermofonsia sichuanensis E412]